MRVWQKWQKTDVDRSKSVFKLVLLYIGNSSFLIKMQENGSGIINPRKYLKY